MEGWEKDRRQRNAGGAVVVVVPINNLDQVSSGVEKVKNIWCFARNWGIFQLIIQINNYHWVMKCQEFYSSYK